MTRHIRSRRRMRVVALSTAVTMGLTACGPSAGFVAERDASRAIVTAIRDSAPSGFVAGAIYGGEWPNEGRGPNMWVNLKLSSDAINAADECTRVREWAVRLGATQYQDGNDGNNPVLPIAGSENQAQATCMKWWQPSLKSTQAGGSSVMIYSGTYSRGGKALGAFSIEANAGVDVIEGQTSLTRWVNVFVATTF